MSVCSQEKLYLFSKKHFTYINQFFGDVTIREIISEIFPSHLKFKIVQAEGFESEVHHVVYDPRIKKDICSVNNQHQNITVDKNDTLCQSYSLLTYFGKQISRNKVTRQMDMIALYRMILSDNRFTKALDDVIFPENKQKWRLYTTNHGYIPMNKKKILHAIHDTLHEWEEYGYHYFIGDGKCPSMVAKSVAKSRSKSISRVGTRQNRSVAVSRVRTRRSESK